MPIEGSDELLVNRSGTTYTLEQQNLMAEIQGDDLLLVNRSGATYTATGQELIDSVIPDLEIVVTFIPNIPYIDEVITVVPNTSGGVEPEGGYTFTYQWSISDDIDGNVNPNNLLGENSDSYTPTEDQQGKFLGCTVQTTDDRGTIAVGTGRTGPIDFKPATDPPVINSVVLTQDAVNDKRFATNSFTTTVDATNRPNALQLEAQVVGALSLDAGTSAITEVDGDTLKFVDATNLDGVVFEVGDKVQQDSIVEFVTSGISQIGSDIDNFTTFYSSRNTETFDFGSVYNDTATVALMRIGNGATGSEGSGQSNGNGGPGGAGGRQGSIYGTTSTVALMPTWETTSSNSGWDELITRDPAQYNGSNPGASGLPGKVPDATWTDYFSDYITFSSGGGGGGGFHNSSSPGAGYGGNGGNGGVRFSRVSTPFGAVFESGQSDDNYIFQAPRGEGGTTGQTDDARGGPGGQGGLGYGGGGGGGGGETTMANNNSGRGRGGAGASDLMLAAVTGQRYFDTAFKFDNPADVQSINVGDNFVASSGATGSVIAVDLMNAAVLLEIDSGSITLSNTLTFTSIIGKGTIDSIDAVAAPPELTLSGKTGSFNVGRYLIHQNPKPIKITPKTEAISGVSAAGDLLTFVGNDELIEFANGDPVSMCNADGTPATAVISSSVITSSTETQPFSYTDAVKAYNGDDIIVTAISPFQNTSDVQPPERDPESQSDTEIYTTNNANGQFTIVLKEPTTGTFVSWQKTRGSGSRMWFSTDGGNNFTQVATGSGGNNSSYGSMNATGTNVTHIRIKQDGETCEWAGLFLNGVRVRDDGPDSGYYTLTFEDNTNLQYFKAGDSLVSGLATGFIPRAYIGNGGAQSITGVGFQPSLVWLKDLSADSDHNLYDILRGPNARLKSNTADGFTSQTNVFNSFDSDGFSIGDSGGLSVNTNDYVAWCWDAGNEPPVTTTSGGATLSTTVKANVDKGFSICRYSGGGGNNSYSHGLGAGPDFVLVKRMFGEFDWATYHSGVPNGQAGVLSLNTNGGWEFGANQWNENIPPDDTAVYLGNNTPQTNLSSADYVAYNWVSTPGISKFGEYQGQNAAHEIDCGFEPALVIIKKYTSGGGHWVMIYPETKYIYANLTFSQGGNSTQRVEFFSSGFRLVGTNHDINAADEKYIYAAWSAQEFFGTVLEDGDTTNNTLVVDGGEWDASNQSQVWSDIASASNLDSSHPISNAFDGNDATWTRTNAIESFLTITFDPPISFTSKVEYLGYVNYAETACEFTVDGVTQNNDSGIDINAGLIDPQDIGSSTYSTYTGSGSLSQIKAGRCQNARTYFSQLRIDGKLLIDAVNDSQVWSSQITGEAYGTNINVGPFTNLFDGDPATYTAAKTSTSCEWTAPANSTYEIYFDSDSSAPPLNINGVDYGGASPATGSNLDTVRWSTDAGNQWTKVSMIKLDGKVMLDNGVRDLGETTAKVVKSGEGVVGSVNLEFNTMTLSSTNGEFIDGFHVTTPEKNAVEMRGYLSFDSAGNNVDLERLPQSPVLMDDVKTPKLNFPSTFSTGEGVDTDLPFPTYLETYVQVSNDLGSSDRVKSNELFPNWTGRPYIAPGSYRVMQDEFADWCYWACSSDYRAAVKTIQDAEETVQELRSKADNMAQEFLNRDDVY